jgi:uncharacterized protein
MRLGRKTAATISLLWCLAAHAQSSAPTSPENIAALKEQAAEHADAKAQFDLGVAFHAGKDVPQDDAKAAIWYRKAAEQGLASAQYNLAVLYANGAGVPLNKSLAAVWFDKAAEQGNVYAQENLGLAYLTGEGVQLDYKRAYFWLEIACASSAPEAVAGERATQRDAAATYLSRADRTRVQDSARKWVESHPSK